MLEGCQSFVAACVLLGRLFFASCLKTQQEVGNGLSKVREIIFVTIPDIGKNRNVLPHFESQ